MKVIILKGFGVIAPYVVEGYIRAFKKLGYEVREINIAKGYNSANVNEIINFKPDLAIAYGVTGFVKINQGYLFRVLKIPLICLYYDCPFFGINDEIHEEIRAYPQYYYSFIWDDYFLELYKKYGFKNGYKIMLAVDTSKFYPLNRISSKNELCFVGGIKDIDLNNIKITYDLNIRNNFIYDVIAIKIKNLNIPVLDICSELFDKAEYETIFALYREDTYKFWRSIYYEIHSEGSAIIRKYILNCIDEVGINVFGNGTWQKENIIFNTPVPYGTDLSRVYQSYDININISSMQLETSVNNRVFDIFGCKGFVLSDYRLDMEKIFPDYWESITFKNLNELGERGEYFLTHPKERKELIEQAYHDIILRHTYENRAEEIISKIC